jgi:glycosyltransferase involved in cell wall biosynthesis
VPYCYDSERFRPTDRTRDTPATLLTVSRLEPYKNHAATIRAAARVGDNVEVRLIGRGPEQDSLERLARSLGVQCRIETDLGDAEVVRAYQQARVVVCPSRFEGFGLTPVEAVASGTPVVASDIPPHREFVGPAGRFFPLDDDAALAATVRLALDDPPPDAGLVRDLTIPAAAQRFLHLLDTLLR